ncbi:MAG: Smr/MutS family protein [Pseudomonadota bacterium]|nr:Smr/MutS family protein [Pseudomonadota bacterium]
MTGKKETNDSDLFRAVMQDVKPLKRRTPRSAASPGSAEKETTPIPASGKKRQVRHAVAIAPPPPPPKPKQSALQHGDITGLDRRTGQRFKRGQLPVEARLDLHGMTQTEAHRALSAFLSNQHAAGRRCVIVVTGKGVGKEGGGVLRNAVPRWLNEAPNRDKVLAFEYARQRDGGAGALYVLLKRKRFG